MRRPWPTGGLWRQKQTKWQDLKLINPLHLVPRARIYPHGVYRDKSVFSLTKNSSEISWAMKAYREVKAVRGIT
jgi:hypothetical protein